MAYILLSGTHIHNCVFTYIFVASVLPSESTHGSSFFPVIEHFKHVHGLRESLHNAATKCWAGQI